MFLSVNYAGFAPVLVEALKEQNSMFKALDARISQVEGGVRSLARELEDYKRIPRSQGSGDFSRSGQASSLLLSAPEGQRMRRRWRGSDKATRRGEYKEEMRKGELDCSSEVDVRIRELEREVGEIRRRLLAFSIAIAERDYSLVPRA